MLHFFKEAHLTCAQNMKCASLKKNYTLIFPFKITLYLFKHMEKQVLPLFTSCLLSDSPAASVLSVKSSQHTVHFYFLTLFDIFVHCGSRYLADIRNKHYFFSQLRSSLYFLTGFPLSPSSLPPLCSLSILRKREKPPAC